MVRILSETESNIYALQNVYAIKAENNITYT